MRAEWNFHQIWMMEKSFVRWATGHAITKSVVTQYCTQQGSGETRKWILDHTSYKLAPPYLTFIDKLLWVCCEYHGENQLCYNTAVHWCAEWYHIVIAAFLVSSQYLNQWWLVVNWTLGNKFQWKFNLNSNLLSWKSIKIFIWNGGPRVLIDVVLSESPSEFSLFIQYLWFNTSFSI